MSLEVQQRENVVTYKSQCYCVRNCALCDDLCQCLPLLHRAGRTYNGETCGDKNDSGSEHGSEEEGEDGRGRESEKKGESAKV